MLMIPALAAICVASFIGAARREERVAKVALVLLCLLLFYLFGFLGFVRGLFEYSVPRFFSEDLLNVRATYDSASMLFEFMWRSIPAGTFLLPLALLGMLFTLFLGSKQERVLAAATG